MTCKMNGTSLNPLG